MVKMRFDFLDGIRGLAALWVVLFHSMLFNGYATEKIKWSENIFLNILQKPLSIGHIAVAIFIVLSGFCLAIPIVNNDLNLKGGFKRYISRRAKRLIPPYYIALLLSGLLIFLFPILQEPHNTAWDNKLPVTIGSVVSHIGLFHNLNNSWIYKINGAHWSIATEWQIYWFFPLILFFWKKYNLLVSFSIITILALILYKIVPFAAPQFLILFFMGVVCCYYAFRSKSFNKINLPLSSVLLCAFFAFLIFRKTSPLIANITLGLFFSYFLYSCFVYKKTHHKTLFLLESKPMEFLGKISYSLYLIHGPFLALANLILLNNFDLTNDVKQIILFVFVIVFILPVSALFYHLVERRFLNN